MRLPEPFRIDGDGVLLFVRLTPRASAEAVGAVEQDAAGRAYLSAKVRAVPEKSQANTALERLIAAWLGIAKSDVTLVAGGTSRLKTLRLSGEGTATMLEDKLGRRTAASG